MGGFQITEEIEAKDNFYWYGTTTISSCIKSGGGPTPIQVLGLVPCDKDIYKFSCDTAQEGGLSYLVDSSGNRLVDSSGNILRDATGLSAVLRTPKLRNQFSLPTFKGDTNTFLFEYPSLDDTEDFRLLKWSSGSYNQVATLTDNTYGTLFPLNTIPDYPEYAGFYLDWTAVFTQFGAGDYIFTAYNSTSPSDSLYSYNFRLQDNIDNYKDGTVAIKLTSQGLFDNPFYSKLNGIRRQWDLETLAWEDSCRYFGKLTPSAFETETSYIRSLSNNNELYYSDKFQTYDLQLDHITFNLLQRLEFYGLNSEGINITDDNEDSVSNFFSQVEIINTDNTSFSTIPGSREVHNVVIGLRNKHTQNYRPRI